MSYLLDTDTVSHHFRRPGGLQHRFIQHSGRLYVSAVGLAELHAWASMRDDPGPILGAIRTALRDEMIVIPFDEECAEAFGKLRGLLRRAGKAVAPMDLLIAATAISHGMTLVTHNTAHFRHVPGLVLDDWVFSS